MTVKSPFVVRLGAMPYLLLTLTVLFWSGNFVVGRAVHGDVPPVGLAFWRWAVGALFLLPFAYPHLKGSWRAIRHHWKVMLVLSALGVATFNTLIYLALQTTTTINAALVTSTMPVLIVFWSWALFRERLTGRQGAAILISGLGVLVLISRGELSALLDLAFSMGDIWVVLAAASYAAYSAILRKRPALHPLAFTFATFLIGDLILLPFYGWEMASGRMVHLDLPTLAAVLYVAVFPSVLAYLFWTRGVEMVGANKAGQFIHLMPVFSGLLAILFLGERLHLFHGAGIGLVLVGVLLVVRGRG